MTQQSILLFVHPPFYKASGKIFFDRQAQNGLRLWAKNFDIVRVMAPLDEVCIENVPSDATLLQPFLDAHPKIETVMLPRRGTVAFLSCDLNSGRKIIREQIRASQYLVFGFSGYIGDWGTLACREAARMGRDYAIFKDGVAHRVARITQQKEKRGLLRRLRDTLENSLMERLDRTSVGGASLSLLHGQDTMEYYGQFSRDPRLVHNIHISKSDRITEEALENRLKTRDPDTLLIAYAGRVEEIKGPDHWVKALVSAHDAGVKLSARWYGTGTLLDEQRQKTAAMCAEHDIVFTGFMDHAEMLPELKRADLFLFTHMTEESPRCLIEALSAGLPLVGYDSAYPRDLVGDSQAGLFVPRGNKAALIQALKDLSADPDRLAAMARDARRIAAPLNDEDVFRHRSDIIKATL